MKLITQGNIEDFMDRLDQYRSAYVEFVKGTRTCSRLLAYFDNLLDWFFNERIKLKSGETTEGSYEASQLRVMSCRYIFAPVNLDNLDNFWEQSEKTGSYRNAVENWLICNFADLDAPLLDASVRESILEGIEELEKVAYNQESTEEAQSKLYRAILAALDSKKGEV